MIEQQQNEREHELEICKKFTVAKFEDLDLKDMEFLSFLSEGIEAINKSLEEGTKNKHLATEIIDLLYKKIQTHISTKEAPKITGVGLLFIDYIVKMEETAVMREKIRPFNWNFYNLNPSEGKGEKSFEAPQKQDQPKQPTDEQKKIN